MNSISSVEIDNNAGFCLDGNSIEYRGLVVPCLDCFYGGIAQQKISLYHFHVANIAFRVYREVQFHRSRNTLFLCLV